MLPLSLIFTSGVASGVNSYAAVLAGPQVLAAAAVLYTGQFVVGKIPVLDSFSTARSATSFPWTSAITPSLTCASL